MIFGLFGYTSLDVDFVSYKNYVEFVYLTCESACRFRLKPPSQIHLSVKKPPFEPQKSIDLSAILQKSLDRALFLIIFIQEARSSGVRASITIVHIRKFYRI